MNKNHIHGVLFKNHFDGLMIVEWCTLFDAYYWISNPSTPTIEDIMYCNLLTEGLTRPTTVIF